SDLRERTRWRTLQNGTIFHREEALTARAFEPIIFRGVIYGAGQVRALLTVGHVLFFGGANHNAMVLRSGVGEEFYTTNRNFIYVGDFYDRKRGRLCKERFHQNRKIANEHAEACESEKLRELAA